MPKLAATIPWKSVSEWAAYWRIDAFLCAEESDYYYVRVEELGFGHNALYVRALVDGSGWCGEGCDQPFLAPAPENTIAIEVYDASTLTLIAQGTTPQGRVFIADESDQGPEDLLVRVSGPVEATYGYELEVEIRNYEGEDECEC